MANSSFLRENRNQHTVKNRKSKAMDADIDRAVANVIEMLKKEYPTLTFTHEKVLKVEDIVAMLSQQYPNYAEYLTYNLKTSSIKPDGGFVFATNQQGERRIILVSEVKRQGTNDARKEEGKPKQARGNAIERLGKNLIGIRTIFKNEGILPFVCFGSGDDFKPGSSILDRVVTMNEFFPLNTTFVEKNYLPFEPVTMLFRYESWTPGEMIQILHEISVRAIQYKFF